MSSSAVARASGSAAKNRFAPGTGSAKFSQPSELNARTYLADGAAAASSARLSNSGAPIRFTASITTLPASAAPCSFTTPGTAWPGTASSTTSAPSSASPMPRTGAPPGPSPEPSLAPKTTSCPAARHLLPSVPPMLPLPMTAIFMPATNQCDARLIPVPGTALDKSKTDITMIVDN